MTLRAIFTTSSGRLVDLLNPKSADIDFTDIAEHLSKENRYNGGTPDTAYSVAEHLCRGADAIVEDLGDTVAAGYFLLHDCPEAYLKDDPTPKKNALARIAQADFGVLGEAVLSSFDKLTRNFDAAIAVAAGLDYPWPEPIANIVHRYDQIMLVTEWRDLKRTSIPFLVAPGIVPLTETIFPWSWPVARTELETRFNNWLPACAARYTDGARER